MTYNGWANWETWNLYNWLSSYPETWSEARAVAMAGGPDQIREWWADQNPLIEDNGGGASWWLDVLLGAVHGVDWHELHAALIED